MGINTYEVMYIQARDNYPYNVEECIEKLQYVIAADDEHTGSHYLMGCIYNEQLEDYKQAEFHYRMVLYLDSTYMPVYYKYAEMLLSLGRDEECQNIISAGFKVKGIDGAKLLWLQGMLFEKQSRYKKAIKTFKAAKLKCLNNRFMDDMDGHIKRIKDKRELVKPKKKDKPEKRKSKK